MKFTAILMHYDEMEQIGEIDLELALQLRVGDVLETLATPEQMDSEQYERITREMRVLERKWCIRPHGSHELEIHVLEEDELAQKWAVTESSIFLACQPGRRS